MDSVCHSFSYIGTIRQRKLSSRTGLHDVSGFQDTSFTAEIGSGELVTQLEGLGTEDADRFKEAAVPLHAKKSFR